MRVGGYLELFLYKTLSWTEPIGCAKNICQDDRTKHIITTIIYSSSGCNVTLISFFIVSVISEKYISTSGFIWIKQKQSSSLKVSCTLFSVTTKNIATSMHARKLQNAFIKVFTCSKFHAITWHNQLMLIIRWHTEVLPWMTMRWTSRRSYKLCICWDFLQISTQQSVRNKQPFTHLNAFHKICKIINRHSSKWIKNHFWSL